VIGRFLLLSMLPTYGIIIPDDDDEEEADRLKLS
jgi:hypothetical protein